MSQSKKKEVPDALASLGTIIGEHERRDAIHLAVTPVIAAHTLRPGEDIGFIDGGAGTCDNPVGIVDPFLKGTVKKGQRFWLVVYPRQITSLRHVWTHPTIADEHEPERPQSLPTWAEKSRTWLANYANSIDVSYDDLLHYAKRYAESGAMWVGADEFEGLWAPGEFWDHYETATGTVVAEKDRGSFFACSC